VSAKHWWGVIGFFVGALFGGRVLGRIGLG
jgi:hypothetical protein